jgi:hypothetical protein
VNVQKEFFSARLSTADQMVALVVREQEEILFALWWAVWQ